LRNALLAVIVMISIPMSILVWDTRGHRRNAAAFRRLDLGMSADEIRKAVRREPDCVVRVSESQVWFYFAKLRDIQCPSAVDTPAELPRDYASLQILVGPSRLVDAIGFDGETQGVRVAGGLVSGSSIAELPPALVQ
jgi:hypothetical protein